MSVIASYGLQIRATINRLYLVPFHSLTVFHGSTLATCEPLLFFRGYQQFLRAGMEQRYALRVNLNWSAFSQSLTSYPDRVSWPVWLRSWCLLRDSALPRWAAFWRVVWLGVLIRIYSRCTSYLRLLRLLRSRFRRRAWLPLLRTSVCCSSFVRWPLIRVACCEPRQWRCSHRLIYRRL